MKRVDCENCIFWMDLRTNFGDEDDIKFSGECHRYAPRAFSNLDRCDDSSATAFPMTMNYDFCGDGIERDD